MRHSSENITYNPIAVVNCARPSEMFLNIIRTKKEMN